MTTLKRFLRSWIDRIFRSVAFLPLPMVVISILIGMGLYWLESRVEWSKEIQENFPSLSIASVATARSTLTLLAGSLLTLTVFTFTQMMTLFSQVANSYSPRLLPVFTGSRSLQFVMGLYLGTILLCIIVLLGVSANEELRVPTFSVLVCAILGMICLITFVYFVTKISNNIQVTNIIAVVYNQGLHYLKRAEKRDGYREKEPPPDFSDWYAIPSPIDGYVGVVNYKRLSHLARDYDTRFYLSVTQGQYVPKNLPLILSERELDPVQSDRILKAVSPVSRSIDSWYLPPIRLLTEIALRALSPGINDPGTAIDVLDRLSSLLSRLMHLSERDLYWAADGNQVWLAHYTFDDILTAVVQEIRTYAAADPLVTRRLLRMLYHLLILAGEKDELHVSLHDNIRSVLATASDNLSNPADRELLARELRAHRREYADVRRQTQYVRDPHLREPGVSTLR